MKNTVPLGHVKSINLISAAWRAQSNRRKMKKVLDIMFAAGHRLTFLERRLLGVLHKKAHDAYL